MRKRRFGQTNIEVIVWEKKIQLVYVDAIT